MTKITETRHWDWGAVRAMCVRHRFYEVGTIDDYDALANVVRCNAPDDLMEIYGVAEDIWAHSGCAESVEDIMSLLCKEAITSCFKVEEG